MQCEDQASLLQRQTAEVRFVAREVGRKLGFANPSLFAAARHSVMPLVKRARFVASHAIDGVFLRAWDPPDPDNKSRVALGIVLYEIDEIRFAIVPAPDHVFLVVESDDRDRLREVASVIVDRPEYAERPVLPEGQIDILWNNTIGYLEEPRLNRINQLGGRARRGVLLTGSPGNGKTMACRWLCDECRRRDWEWTIVTPDGYQNARQNNCVEILLSVSDRGIIFFDDMDRALRDRETRVSDDQSVLLAAMDGMEVKRGVIFVFTTNCSLELIDRAFKRPGRIDVALEFRKPDAALRLRLIEGWNPEITSNLDIPGAVDWTDGFSFAEIEELKNLLIVRFMDVGQWDWDWATLQFKTNRLQLRPPRRKRVGFLPGKTTANGSAGNRPDIGR